MLQNFLSLQTVLRPETVLELEDVPFVKRAQALPGVVEAHYSIHDVSLADSGESDEKIEVSDLMNISPDTEERMIVTDKFILAGGLAYDHDSSHLNPCEDGAANGNIYHAGGRRGSSDEKCEFYRAMGMVSDGNRDLSCQSVQDRLLKKVMKGIGDDLGTFMRLIHRLRATGREVSKQSLAKVVQFSIEQEGWQYALDYLADNLYGVPYWNRLDDQLQETLEPLVDLFTEATVESCWDEACSAGEVGNPFAVELDIYEHSGIAYSVSGTGMQCRWDTSRCAAVWVPDDEALDNIKSSVLHEAGAETLSPEKLKSLMQAKARQYCKGVLEDYNNWANGWVYGVVSYVIDRETGERIEEHDSEVWGYLGSEYAEEELEAQMLATALDLGQSLH